MFNVIRLIDTVDEAARDRLIEKLRTATDEIGVDEHLVRPTLAGVRNGGDILTLLRFPDVNRWLSCAGALDSVLADPAVTHVNGATYSGTLVATTETKGTIYRTLLLRVQPDTDDTTLARFENDLRLLPRYVTAIHSWQLSRVESATSDEPWRSAWKSRGRRPSTAGCSPPQRRARRLPTSPAGITGTASLPAASPIASAASPAPWPAR